MAENQTFGGGFRTSPRPVAGSDRSRKFSGLGSEAPLPTAKKVDIPSEAAQVNTLQNARNFPDSRGSTTGSRNINAQEKVPLSKQNSEFAANFARESKELATKRGLTGAQRRSQLGALTNSFKLRSAGIADDDPRAVAIRDLGESSNERGLSGLQRRLQGASASSLLSDTLSDEKSRPLTFDEQLDKDLGI